MSDEAEIWYRYDDERSASFTIDGDFIRATPIKVVLRGFKVVKHTPKGVQLRAVFSLPYKEGQYLSSDKRFVLHDSVKQYACPTIEKARVSFRARKKKQLQIYKAAVRRAEHALQCLEQLESKDPEGEITRDESYDPVYAIQVRRSKAD